MKTFIKLCAALALFGCSSSTDSMTADSGTDAAAPTDLQLTDVLTFEMQERADVPVTSDVPAVDRPPVDAPTVDSPAADRVAVDSPPPACPLPNGGSCAVGSTCPAGDGCNDCTCSATGALMCTARPCAADAGPRDALTDAVATDAPAACRLANGARCPVGSTCPAGDGCNDCTCDADGTTRCTARPCAFDAGPTHPTCTATRECHSGEECAGAMGCTTPWMCRPATGTLCADDVVPYCGCDGRTFYGSSTCPPGPYARRGACGS